MNRKMIKVNQLAFDKLIDQFNLINKKDCEEVLKTDVRYIATSDEEKNWLKSATVPEIIHINPTLRVIKIEFNMNTYIAIVGSELSEDLDSNVLKEIEPNAGIITYLISEGILKLHKNIDTLHFYNEILCQHKDKNYKGHDYNDLQTFLESIHLFEVPVNSIFSQQSCNCDTSKITCYIYSINTSSLTLDFDKEVTNFVSNLSLNGLNCISYSIISNALFANTYEHAFLELYRLIEMLFPINYLREFYEKVNTSLSFLEFVKSLEDITKWRPREEEAIEKIFKLLNKQTEEYFKTFQKNHKTIKDLSFPSFFYSLRNTIVHFRANHKKYELTPKQWNLLIIATLSLIENQYKKNEKFL